jgi:hypothetical protein
LSAQTAALVNGKTVHRGFLSSWIEWMNDRQLNGKSDWDADDTPATFWTALKADIQTITGMAYADIKTIVFGGHSLGGAIAQLMSYAVSTIDSTKLYCTTYGCPNVWSKIPYVERKHRWRNYVLVAIAKFKPYIGKEKELKYIDPVPVLIPTYRKIGDILYLANKKVNDLFTKKLKEDRSFKSRGDVRVIAHFMTTYLLISNEYDNSKR